MYRPKAWIKLIALIVLATLVTRNINKSVEIRLERKTTETTTISTTFSVPTRKVKKVIIRGERHSGTNWFRSLLSKNCPSLTFKLTKSSDIDSKYGWKHAKLNLTSIPEDELIVVITRDIKTWLPRLRLNTYEKVPASGLNMTEFLTSKWLPDLSVDDHYRDVFHMRYEKYSNWYNYAQKFSDRVVLVKYEDLVKDSYSVFQKLKNYGVPVNDHFQDIKTYSKHGRRNDKIFTEPEYDWLAKDLEIIDKKYDEHIENLVGYK